MSGISITPAVARARDQHEHDRVGVVDHVDLRLTDPDGLEEHVVLAGGVHQQRRLQRRLGEAAERAARRHRADEDAGIEEVLAEPDAVAEQRAAAERRARVDREHGDLAVARAAQLDERADQRRLAGARRAREADDGRVAGARVDLADERPALRVVVLDERDRARERALVAGEQPLGESPVLRHQGRGSWQAPRIVRHRWSPYPSHPRPRSSGARRCRRTAARRPSCGSPGATGC
jgi:hypothetical protein